MKKLWMSVFIIIILAACSNRHAGAHITNGGKARGYIGGDVLKF